MASATVGPRPVGDGCVALGAEQLTGRTHQPQPVVRAPHQRLRTQLRDRPGQLGGDRGVPGVPGHQRAQRVVRARVGRHRQCLGGLEHEPVEALHRAHDRRPRPGPGGELGDIAGHRIEQVGTGPQQPDEPAVGAGPELLGEGAGCTGHSSYVSGAGPDGGPCGGSPCAQRRHGTRTPPRSVPREPPARRRAEAVPSGEQPADAAGDFVGIESDQLVYDYLSRVGDLAQQRGLPAATRMRLVTGLRAEIDGQQADSVSGVKRILARLGTPEAVVTAAGSADDRVPGASRGGPSARPEPAAGRASAAGPAVRQAGRPWSRRGPRSRPGRGAPRARSSPVWPGAAD